MEQNSKASFVRQSAILLVIYFTLSECAYPPTLVHVNMLYRHGDRSPVFLYPTDNHQLDSWPDGLGWLSTIGEEQQYKLGQYLRDRYGGFINVTRYDHSQIAIEASSVERCLMSAYSNLAGFFPPQGDQVWNDKFPWQPIPVLTTPKQLDNKLAMGAPCPRYDQLLEKVYELERVKKYQADNVNFFKMVSNATGMKESLYDIWQVGDILVCEKAHNLTWNAWAYGEGVYEHMKEVVTFGWQLLYYFDEMAKLKGGPLVKEMIENMKAASNKSSGPLKMHMYSAHDSTVAAVTRAMTVFNGLQPPYRTLVLVELHKINDEDIVKILFRNDTTKEPYNLIPKGCEDPCKLSTFEKLMKNTIPQDWQAECKTVTSASSLHLSAASWIALALGFAIGGIIVAALAILIVRKRGRDYYKL